MPGNLANMDKMLIPIRSAKQVISNAYYSSDRVPEQTRKLMAIVMVTFWETPLLRVPTRWFGSNTWSWQILYFKINIILKCSSTKRSGSWNSKMRFFGRLILKTEILDSGFFHSNLFLVFRVNFRECSNRKFRTFMIYTMPGIERRIKLSVLHYDRHMINIFNFKF